MISELRDELLKARALTESGDLTGVRRILDQALADLRADRLVTVAQAAEILDLRAVEALPAIMRHEGLPIQPLGDTWLVPLSEVDRVRDSDWVRDMRASDRLHDLADQFGAGGARYVVSENIRDFPPRGQDGRHIHEGLEYLPTRVFLDRLVRGEA